MKFFVDYWYLFAAALISGGMLFWPMIRKGAVGGISTAQAVHLINRERAVMIDVRDSAQYATGHVAGAKNVPFDTLKTSTALPKNKSLPIVLVCDSGAHSARGVLILKERGYLNTQSLKGGVPAWREANLPVEKSA